MRLMNLMLALFWSTGISFSLAACRGDEAIFSHFCGCNGRLSILQADGARNPKPVVVECLSTENGPATVWTPAKSWKMSAHSAIYCPCHFGSDFLGGPSSSPPDLWFLSDWRKGGWQQLSSKATLKLLIENGHFGTGWTRPSPRKVAGSQWLGQGTD
jgi:hypothetical protein